ncbi:hypothetical protein PF003_g27873 [Phytophthora fragariae]|nr:hypothetical protein PF003_g27873 [Phytophthora fragariae]
MKMISMKIQTLEVIEKTIDLFLFCDDWQRGLLA